MCVHAQLIVYIYGLWNSGDLEINVVFELRNCRTFVELG